jgi:hypothetical protein
MGKREATFYFDHKKAKTRTNMKSEGTETFSCQNM